MLIAISAEKNDLDSKVDERFGRASGFIIFDLDSEEFRYINNSKNSSLGGGAGVQTSRLIAESGVKAVIAQHFGPSAHSTLDAVDIKKYSANSTVRQAIEDFKSGALKEIKSPDVHGHWS